MNFFGFQFVMKRVLFVFDFDDTLVEGWSDSWILQVAPSLNLHEKIPKLYEQHDSWCDMMDHVMYLIYESGCSKHDVVACMKKLKIKDGMARFLKGIKDHPNADAMIISDGNTQFIAAALEAAGCSDAVLKVYANPACFDELGRLRVKTYHSHTCQRCKEGFCDTCKSAVLSSISTKDEYDRVVYVGDGKNDVCPCVNELTSRDCVVARKGYPLAGILTKLLSSHSTETSCSLKPRLQVVDFSAPTEIETFLTEQIPKSQ